MSRGRVIFLGLISILLRQLRWPIRRGLVLRMSPNLRCVKYLHWFLQEQREEVSSMSDLLKLVERASESNLLLAEESLARTAVGDQGAVDASAPPAAGGAL
jgi:hypothetical protein